MSKKVISGAGWSFVSSKDKKQATPLAENRSNKIKITKEKRAQGKIVTIIGPFPYNMTEIKKLAKELKSACGTGGTVKNEMIEIQGDFIDRARIWLDTKNF